MESTTSKLAYYRCIPMAKTFGPEDAKPLAEALRTSTLKVVNVSQHTEAGQLLLPLLTNEDDLLVGGGNVQTLDQAKRALDNGAKFIFSPLFDEQMIALCQSRSIPIYPVTTQALLAKQWHLSVLGCYPAEELGGLAFINRLAGEADLSFIVAGHIGEELTAQYLSNRHVLAMTGSWMFQYPDWEGRLKALYRARFFAQEATEKLGKLPPR